MGKRKIVITMLISIFVLFISGQLVTAQVKETSEISDIEETLYFRSIRDDEVFVRCLAQDENQVGMEESGVLFIVYSRIEESENDKNSEAEFETEAGHTEYSTELETEAETETETETAIASESLAELGETEREKEMIERVVIFNGILLQDESLHKEYENVKAVLCWNEKTEEELVSAIEKFDLESEAKSYLNKVKAAAQSEQTEEEQSESEEAVQNTETGLNRSARNAELNGINVTNETESETKKETESDQESETETTKTSVMKDVKIELIPDVVEEGDDILTATYDITSSEEISDGKVTITYDKSKMTYNSADASDAIEKMMTKIADPESGDTEEGTIVLTFAADEAEKVTGGLIDLYFDLKSNAKQDDTYEIKLEVNEIKNGNKSLTYEVIQDKIKVGQEEEESSEEETSTTKSTNSNQTSAKSTKTSSSSKTTAAKTGDETKNGLWILLFAGALTILISANGKRRKV